MSDDGLSPAEQAYFESGGENVPEQEKIEAVEAPKAEPVDNPEPKDEAKEQPDKTVPYQALAEERNKRKEFQRQTRELNEKLARLEGRLDILHKTATAEQQEAPRPTLDKDPIGVVRAHEQDIPALRQKIEEFERTREQDAQRQQLVGWVNTQVNEFKAQKPDYDDAIAHLRTQRVAEYENQGYDQNEILQLLNRDEMILIQNAAQVGRNPGSFAYALAIEQGYTPKQAKAMATADQKVEAINKGQGASKSLSAVPGAAGASLSLETLANMSDDEFAEAVKGDKWRKLFA